MATTSRRPCPLHEKPKVGDGARHIAGEGARQTAAVAIATVLWRKRRCKFASQQGNSSLACKAAVLAESFLSSAPNVLLRQIESPCLTYSLVSAPGDCVTLGCVGHCGHVLRYFIS